jgi:hypothetical protein
MKNYVIVVITSIDPTLVGDPWSLQQGPMIHAQSALCRPPQGGKIASLIGSELIVTSPRGDVKLTVSDKTVIRA